MANICQHHHIIHHAIQATDEPSAMLSARPYNCKVYASRQSQFSKPETQDRQPEILHSSPGHSTPHINKCGTWYVRRSRLYSRVNTLTGLTSKLTVKPTCQNP